MTTSRRMATRSQSLDSPATSASRIDSTRSGERPTINDGFYTLLFIRVHAEFDAVPVRSSSALARNFAPAENGSWGFLGPPIRSKFAREWKGKRKKKERKKRKNSRQGLCAKKHAMRQFVTGLRNCGSTFQTDLYKPFLSLCVIVSSH